MSDKTPADVTSDGLWIAIGDIHDDMGNFARIPELSQARGVIISGDLTVNGGVQEAEKVLGEIEKLKLPVLAQIGNMDKAEVDQWLSEHGNNLHAQVHELTPQIAIFGVGGSIFTPFGTPSEFPEEAYAAWLMDMWRKARDYPHAILVSHNPPIDSATDDIGGNTHVGSISVRTFIEQAQPDICICGHIHEGKAIETIGKTILVNPGTLSHGGYVIIRLKNGRLTAELGQVEE